MGYKNICLNCKRVESLGSNSDNFRINKCPECSTQMVFVDQRFKPPKKDKKKEWKIVQFLIQNGFRYHKINGDIDKKIKYPKNMDEAKEFLKIYKNHLYKPKN